MRNAGKTKFNAVTDAHACKSDFLDMIQCLFDWLIDYYAPKLGGGREHHKIQDPHRAFILCLTFNFDLNDILNAPWIIIAN